MLVAELNCYCMPVAKGTEIILAQLHAKTYEPIFPLYNNLACSVCSCTEVAPEIYIKGEGKHAKSNLEVTIFVPTIIFLKDKWHIFILMNPSTLCFFLHNMFSWYCQWEWALLKILGVHIYSSGGSVREEQEEENHLVRLVSSERPSNLDTCFFHLCLLKNINFSLCFYLWCLIIFSWVTFSYFYYG